VIGALVVSEDSRDYLSYAFPGLDVGHIHQRIDRDIFHLDLASRRKQIAVMPRKRPQDYRQVLGMLTSRGVLDGWTIAELSGMTEAEVGSALRESVLFISLNRAEGFGLPPAEAMASGCYIIGFHGMAGREYFREPFATPIEDGDVVALARSVEEFVASYEQRAQTLADVAEEASRFVLDAYSKEREESDLTRFFEKALARRPTTSTRVTVRARELRIEPRWRHWLRRRLLPLARRVFVGPAQ
jgi:glycosyltransferase involved in cell wall biosynthesis